VAGVKEGRSFVKAAPHAPKKFGTLLGISLCMKNSIFFALIAITFSALGANAQVDPQNDNDRLQRVEERLDAHNVQLDQQDERIQENENFRLFGTAAFAAPPPPSRASVWWAPWRL